MAKLTYKKISFGMSLIMANGPKPQDLSRLIPIPENFIPSVFSNIHHVLYRFTEEVIEECSERNNINTREVTENHKLLLFLKYWMDKNPNYQKFFESQIGRQDIRREGVVFRTFGNSLFMFLVMGGRIPVVVRENGKRKLKRMESIGDLALIRRKKQVTERNDARLKLFYTSQNSLFGNHRGSLEVKLLYRNVRGIIDIIGKYPGIARHFGREVSYDDFEHKGLN